VLFAKALLAAASFETKVEMMTVAMFAIDDERSHPLNWSMLSYIVYALVYLPLSSKCWFELFPVKCLHQTVYA
jgi:hypothetical protein